MNDTPPDVRPIPISIEPHKPTERGAGGLGKIKNTWLPVGTELRYIIPPIGGINPNDKNRF